MIKFLLNISTICILLFMTSSCTEERNNQESDSASSIAPSPTPSLSTEASISDPSERNAGSETKYPRNLPEFKLLDPHGKMYTSKSLGKNDLILIVTAPTFENKEQQEGWSNLLLPRAKGKKLTFAFLEDITQSNFKNFAVNQMKNAVEPGQEPIFLLDDEGIVRKKLNVDANETVVLAYKEGGIMVYAENQEPNSKRAGEIMELLK